MSGTRVIYAEDYFGKIESKQDECRTRGLSPSGYGMMIAMPYLVRLNGNGPWRRVYCTQISNAGSVWIKVMGVKYHFRNDENLRLTGEWPKN